MIVTAAAAWPLSTVQQGESCDDESQLQSSDAAAAL